MFGRLDSGCEVKIFFSFPDSSWDAYVNIVQNLPVIKRMLEDDFLLVNNDRSAIVSSDSVASME